MNIINENECKVDNCTREITRYPVLKVCNMHYVRHLKTGSYEQAEKATFNGSTYQVPRNRNDMTGAAREKRVQFTTDRDAAVVKLMFELRNKYESAGIYVKTAELKRELETTINIAATTIERIVRLSGMSKMLNPSEDLARLKPEPAEVVIVKRSADIHRFHTVAW